MIAITNYLREPVHFTTGIKDGQPVVEHVRPGETKNIEIREDHPEVVAKINAGSIKIESALRGRAASSSSKTTES